MKRSILAAASLQSEDVHQYTVAQRVFETVLRCLDEPLRVAAAKIAKRKSTKRILNLIRHPLEACRIAIQEQGKAREGAGNGGHSSPVRRQGAHSRFEVPYIGSEIILADAERGLVVVLVGWHGTTPEKYGKLGYGYILMPHQVPTWHETAAVVGGQASAPSGAAALSEPSVC